VHAGRGRSPPPAGAVGLDGAKEIVIVAAGSSRGQAMAGKIVFVAELVEGAPGAWWRFALGVQHDPALDGLAVPGARRKATGHTPECAPLAGQGLEEHGFG